MQMHLTGFMIYCPAPHTAMSWVYPREKIRHQWYEIGCWEEIARTLEDGLFDGGGHGFQLTPRYYAPDYYRDIVELLIPELQRRRVYRTSYAEGTVRDRMGGGLPPRWTAPTVADHR